MTLEVFETNTRAALYQSREFESQVRLHGWKRDGVATQPLLPRVDVGPRLEPVSLADLATALPHAVPVLETGTIPKSDRDPDSASWWAAFRYPSLPWQISLSAARVLPASVRAFGTGDAVAVVLEPGPRDAAVVHVASSAGTRGSMDIIESHGGPIARRIPDPSLAGPGDFP